MSELEKPRLVIVMDGGVLHAVIADKPVDVMVVDYDANDVDPERLRPVPQVDAYGNVLGHHCARVFSHFVEIEKHGRWLPGIFDQAKAPQTDSAPDN